MVLTNTSDMGAHGLRQISPLFLDMQTHFLQVRALADSKEISVQSLKEIKLLSKHALNTLDHALFAIDVMQTELPLTTLSAAAAAQDVASDLRKLATAYGVELDIDITKKLEPVYANEAAIKGALYGLASSLITTHQPSKKKVCLVIAAQETAPNIQRLGVYSPDLQISPSTIRLARSLVGQARSMAPTETYNAGLGLVVSDQLVQSLGSKMRRFTHRGQKGLGFYVPISSQLSFV